KSLGLSYFAGSTYARDWTGVNPTRYPDPDVRSLDTRFNQYRLGNASIRRIYSSPDMLWAEGPAWSSVGKYLLWSDIPNNKQLRWLQDDGEVTEFRKPSGNSNGNTFDHQGRQISCEHGNQRVVRYELDGSVTVLTDSYAGKKYNAPNDVVVHPDGSIWFTDPGYGSLMNYEGTRLNTGSVQPVQKEAVYRIDSKTFKVTKLTDEIFKPNGLCFSPDYKKLYVSDTGASHYPQASRQIKVWNVLDNNTLKNGKSFASMEMEVNGQILKGGADGIKCDEDGNIWSSAGWAGHGYDGVHIFEPKEGNRIGQILLPEICSNLCFGGEKRNRLFMTASQSIYSLYVETKGAHFC
ncbi:MAG: SMP-30/gluconolactonase/LRE family protein, partial [Rhodobacterales bacterium]|nr:SMP-30/gluconolactonase/LRE family protein [Rhodobacterales bacterium]